MWYPAFISCNWILRTFLGPRSLLDTREGDSVTNRNPDLTKPELADVRQRLNGARTRLSDSAILT